MSSSQQPQPAPEVEGPPTLSLVVPCYNEQNNVAPFLAKVTAFMAELGETYEIVFVNDGSRDDTLPRLIAAASQDPRVRVVGLARNFGKEIALTAGIQHARGRAVVPIDIDLQHPPELIREFLTRWRAGADMVVGVRSRRDEEGWLRRKLSQTFYVLLARMTRVKITPNAGDYRLLDRKIVDVLNQMPERCRFMKGLYAWPGFKSETVEFQAAQRLHDQSSWSFWKLWNLALDGVFSFSRAPLQVWTYVGLCCAFAAFVYLVITLVQRFVYGVDVPGYASLLVVMLFFNGMLLVSNGIMGEYIARIFDEVKGRPLYVVEHVWGDQPAVAAQHGRAPGDRPGVARPPVLATGNGRVHTPPPST
jgi:glycosyltransferase involved in cell wall biosynthesis